jgi:AcrR family transcriptional regulator
MPNNHQSRLRRKPTRAPSSPTANRRERAKGAKRARIIEAARQLFAEKGFTATTTQEIAARADVGTGTLFLYAQTKEDLLVMVFRDEIVDISRRSFKGALKNASLLDQLMFVFRTMVRYHDRDIEISRVLMRQVTVAANVERLADVKAMLDVVREGISKLIAPHLQSGRLRTDIDLIDAAEVLFAVYFLGLLQWLSGHRTKEAFLRQLPLELGLVIRGFSSARD